MNYYKGLEEIGKTGEFKNIPDELLHDYINDFTLEFNNRSLVKKLNIPDVGSTFAVEFAQYIAEEHYRLVNVQNGNYYWKDETSLRTTEQLLDHFKNPIQ